MKSTNLACGNTMHVNLLLQIGSSNKALIFTSASDLHSTLIFISALLIALMKIRVYGSKTLQ